MREPAASDAQAVRILQLAYRKQGLAAEAYIDEFATRFGHPASQMTLNEASAEIERLRVMPDR